jgi:multicomponent Na+:H+ antiporter subunit D
LGFTVGALSMIGIPLFGGFVSKLYFASAAVPTGMTAMILLTIALSTVLNALYYVPALLAIWVKPPAEDEALVLADVHPGDLAADRAFTAAAAILIVGIFVLGIFYHPITDLIEAGLRLVVCEGVRPCCCCCLFWCR